MTTLALTPAYHLAAAEPKGRHLDKLRLSGQRAEVRAIRKYVRAEQGRFVSAGQAEFLAEIFHDAVIDALPDSYFEQQRPTLLTH